MTPDKQADNADIVRLVLRAGPFVLSNPDIAISPLPSGKSGYSQPFPGWGPSLRQLRPMAISCACGRILSRKNAPKATREATAGRPVLATFRLEIGNGVVGDVCFGNVAGSAQIFRPGASRPCATIPFQWDEHFGFWPTLHAAAEKLRGFF